MGLSRGLRRLPADRQTELSIRETLLALKRHEGEWLAVERIAAISGVSPALSANIIGALAEASVLAEEREPPRYRFAPDRLLSMEVESFLRRADVRTGKLQDNVARFRERYGGR